MEFVTLGSTKIKVNKNGFGALPIQRVSKDSAVKLLQRAYNFGFTYFDTARSYTDSEEKIGYAFGKMREKIIIATKTAAKKAQDFWKDLEISLEKLKTDYIDIYQFHNPPFCPIEGDSNGLYDAALQAKKKGLIKHIGITNHRLDVAKKAIESGLYETLQFPFSYISTDAELELVKLCKEKNMGFVAMKGLCGGLLTDYRACYAFSSLYENVLSIWGIQKEDELDQWISCIDNPPMMTEELEKKIDKDRKELSGDFCRGCGYCMPCSVGIEINNCARMVQLIRRSPTKQYLEKQWIDKMRKINDCINCNKCKSKCPYSLDTPNLLRKSLADFENIIAGRVIVD